VTNIDVTNGNTSKTTKERKEDSAEREMKRKGGEPPLSLGIMLAGKEPRSLGAKVWGLMEKRRAVDALMSKAAPISEPS